jgi:hypothetical protein
MQHISHPGVSVTGMPAFRSSSVTLRFGLIFVVLISMLGWLHGPAQAGNLQLLQPGQHIGLHRGISPNHPDLEDYWTSALNAGMDTQVVAFNWNELEPTKGTYNKQLLQSRLAQAEAESTAPMLMLTGPQTDEMALPHDLDGREGFALRYGRSIDDPVIVERYKQLLDWVVPMLSAFNGWAIVVGNEVDMRLQKEPAQAASYLNFLKAARDHVHWINPDMAVAMTVTAAPVYLADPMILPFIAESDFASYTFYCDASWSGWMEPTLDFVMPYLQASANQKPIVFQEFGCASGYVDGRPSGIANSPAIQAEFTEAFIKVVDRTPQVRAAYAYQLSDLSSAEIDYYLALGDTYLVTKEQRDYWTGHIELLGTLGLCENDTGTTKPAWQKLVAGIEVVE